MSSHFPETGWTDRGTNDLGPGQIATTITATALYDNIIATAQGQTGAPRIRKEAAQPGEIGVVYANPASDVTLKPGDICYAEISGSSTIRLPVNVEAGGHYHITAHVFGASTTDTVAFFRPNDTDHTGEFENHATINNNGTLSGSLTTGNDNWRLGSGINWAVIDIHAYYAVSGQRKKILTQWGADKGTGKIWQNNFGEWKNTTTTWSTLGTLGWGGTPDWYVSVHRIR